MTGRCATCRHWRDDDSLADIYNGSIGDCTKLDVCDLDRSTETLAFPQSMEGDGWLKTRPTFGCVLWEQTG